MSYENNVEKQRRHNVKLWTAQNNINNFVSNKSDAMHSVLHTQN